MTPQEFANKIRQKYPEGVSSDGRKYSAIPDLELSQKIIDKYPVYKDQVKMGETGLKGFATGVGKGVLSTLKGAGELGTTIGKTFLDKPLEAITGKGLQTAPVLTKGTKENLNADEILKARTTSEKIGKGAEQIAEFAIPGTKVAKATKEASLIGKIAPRALTSGTVATVQSGEVGKEAGIAAGIETALPIVGKVLVQPAKNLLGRLLKGVGGGLSGTPTNLIENLIENPKLAQSSIKELEKQGTGKVLEQNAKTILNGVSKIRQEARKSFGEGLEQLAETDIKPKVFKDTIKPTLDKFGSFVENGKRTLKNIEFDDPKNIQKASNLIGRLSKTPLNGKALRKLADDIENSSFKTATSDERLAFNAFIKDLSGTLKKAVSNSTDKLTDINKAFSSDMQLTEAVEDIFGKVNYKNLSEVREAALKLENLFTKKGIDPEIIDSFLNRIEAGGLKTSEAVRQISTKTTGANAKGLSVGELLQQVTSSIVTPKTVRNAAIFTGIAEPVMKNILENLSPTARAAFIKSLTQD